MYQDYFLNNNTGHLNTVTKAIFSKNSIANTKF